MNKERAMISIEKHIAKKLLFRLRQPAEQYGFEADEKGFISFF